MQKMVQKCSIVFAKKRMKNYLNRNGFRSVDFATVICLLKFKINAAWKWREWFGARSTVRITFPPARFRKTRARRNNLCLRTNVTLWRNPNMLSVQTTRSGSSNLNQRASGQKKLCKDRFTQPGTVTALSDILVRFNKALFRPMGPII